MIIEVLKEWLGESAIKKFSFESERDDQITLCIGDNLFCFIEPTVSDISASIFIYIPLIRLPDHTENRVRLLEQCLIKNSFNLETGVATIGVDTRSDYIFLGHQTEFELYDKNTFNAILEDVIENGLTLKINLAELSQSISLDESESESQSQASIDTYIKP